MTLVKSTDVPFKRLNAIWYHKMTDQKTEFTETEINVIFN